MGNFKMDYSRKDVPLVDDKQSVKDCKNKHLIMHKETQRKEELKLDIELKMLFM